MSMAEHRKYRNRKGESKAHSLAHKYDMKKMASVLNHIDYERHHGFESARRGKKLPDKHASSGGDLPFPHRVQSLA